MLEEFQKFGRLLFAERLVDSHGGNMSVLSGDKILITRRDCMLGDLQAGDIVEVGLEAGEGDEKASRELETHRALYKQCGAKAVVHAHPANAIAISITDNRIVPQDAEGLFLYKAAPIVRVRDGVGSNETVRLLPSFLKDNSIAVVKGHGSFATAPDLETAYKLTSCLENSCRVLVAVRASGSQNQIIQKQPQRRESHGLKSAIPPSIGVMDRNRYRKR